MTSRHKTFVAREAAHQPLTFDIEGVDTKKKKWIESFSAIPEVPGAEILDFIADADSDDGGRAAQALIDFLEGVIIEEDRERFAKLIRDKQRIIEMELIAQICEWLVSEYTDRPTESPRPQRNGRSRSGRGSTARASSRA